MILKFDFKIWKSWPKWFLIYNMTAGSNCACNNYQFGRVVKAMLSQSEIWLVAIKRQGLGNGGYCNDVVTCSYGILICKFSKTCCNKIISFPFRSNQKFFDNRKGQTISKNNVLSYIPCFWKHKWEELSFQKLWANDLC